MILEANVGLLRILFETALVSFIISVLAGPKLIPALHKMKFGQEVRNDGPESHLKKQGTPTMGGIMILGSLVCAAAAGYAALGKADTASLKILFLTLAFGVTGFADDYIKIKRHNTEGLKPKQKLAFQLIAALVFAVWACLDPSDGFNARRIYIPFTGYGETALYFELPVWAFIPFTVFVCLGTDNGTNFTDGLDGLCSSVTVVVALFFAAIGIIVSPGTALASAALAGALMGFLMFNSYPAKVFMGDTGSLGLGGFVAACAVVTGTELYIVIVGFIYLAEVLSVIIQVGYFKATKGKRFFRMAPVHHHFELCGNSETRIVTAFTIVTALLAGLSAIGFLYVR